MIAPAPPLLVLLLVAPVPLPHATLTTHVHVPPHLTVGDRFEETVVVSRPAGGILTGPLADTLGVFAVGGEQRSSHVHAGVEQTTYRLSLAGFQPGRQRVPPLTFLVLAGDRTDTLRSDTASVTIASVLPGSFRDIHGLKPAESFPNYALWIVPAALLLLAALAWAGYRLYRRLRHGAAAAAPPPPPWDEALAALDAMPWSEWLEGGQFKRCYYSLSEVLKRYIERRFEFGAAEQTSTEMLAAMRAHRTPMRDDVARFLLRSDLVKYSKVVPPRDEAEAAIAQVREFVNRTRPQEPEPAAAAAGGAAPKAGG